MLASARRSTSSSKVLADLRGVQCDVLTWAVPGADLEARAGSRASCQPAEFDSSRARPVAPASVKWPAARSSVRVTMPTDGERHAVSVVLPELRRGAGGA